MSATCLHILLADDDIDDCVFFKQILTELELPNQLDVVHDGEELMRLLLNETCPLPDVLFLDINMPRRNGLECLEDIKLSKRLIQLPVIMFSTSYEQEVVNLLYKSGAQHFIRKPPGFIQFKKIIHQALAQVIPGKLRQPAWENFVITVETDPVYGT